MITLTQTLLITFKIWFVPCAHCFSSLVCVLTLCLLYYTVVPTSQDKKRTFVCASSCIKQYVQPSYGCRGKPVVAGMCVYTARKN